MKKQITNPLKEILLGPKYLTVINEPTFGHNHNAPAEYLKIV